MTAPPSPPRRGPCPVVGLSVGTTTLVAVGPDGAVTRPPVVTRAGLPITDFVDRVGDPVGIVAADGTLHPAAALLAEACAGLARAATAGRPQTPQWAVAYPAHWTPTAVEALRRALRRTGPDREVTLVGDWASALKAVDAGAAPGAGVPDRGVVAVCDFGGSGTAITLVDAGNGRAPVAPTLRYPEFCGDLVDQAVLARVLAQAAESGTAAPSGTAAIGPLTRLRGQCRAAKERLSAVTATTLAVEVGGFRGEMRLTRPELDEMIRVPLAGVVAALRDLLERNGIRPAELTAVASVGGGAAIPAVTAALSEAFRVPVLTTAYPVLAAATGAALCATGPAAEPAAVTAVLGRPAPAARPALAWSHAVDIPELTPPQGSEQPAAASPVRRPRLDFHPGPAAPRTPTPRYRRPVLLTAAAVLAITGAAAATAVALRADSTAAPVAPAPSVTTTGEPAAEPAPPAAESVSAVPRRTVVAVPAPEPDGPSVAPAPRAEPVVGPPVTETATATVVSTPAPVTETVTAEPPPPAEPPPSVPPPDVLAPLIPAIPTITIPAIPGLPPLFTVPPG